MKKWIRRFFSFPVTLVLLIIYAVACGIATFVENDFGTQSAKALVYGALWFDVLHLILSIELLGVLGFLLAKKKYANFLLHFSFLLIVIGAGMTRYFGIDGGMHIRKGEKSNTIVTRDELLKIIDFQSNETFSFPIFFTPLIQKEVCQKVLLGGVEFEVLSQNYSYDKAQNKASLTLQIKNATEQKTLTLSPSYNQLMPETLEIEGRIFEFVWVPKEIQIPFEIKLKDFVIDYYLGSMNPSAYSSDVLVEDGKKSFSFVISMNRVLDYGGYRFYQSSYDMDKEGTILSVNYDPGKMLTYFGYGILCIGFLGIFFSKKGRFFVLRNYLKKQNLFALLLCCMPLCADSALDLIEKMQKSPKEEANRFGELWIQDFEGRIKPLDTLTMDFIHKITKQDQFLGLNYNQIFLGMMIYPEEFRQIRMFAIQSEKLKEILGTQESYVAFNDVMSQDGGYILANYVQNSSQKAQSKRNAFDKEILKLDEKINIAYYIYSAKALRIFPSNDGVLWYSPAQTLPKEQEQAFQTLFGEMFFGFHQGIQEGHWERYNQSLEKIKTIQEHYAKHLLPSQWQKQCEIFLNHTRPFVVLIYVDLLLGLLLFACVFVSIFKNKTIKIMPMFYYALILSLCIHSIGLIVRWYVGGHAPWSNAYESMIYIAWACVVAGVVCFKKSYLALCASSLVAGIALFVANLGFMDPQIGNLVPVLKSYWLNIHVSVITASYGFLALCFMLGIVELLLFVLRSPQRVQIDQSILNLHCINEISMMIGLAMLTIGNFLGGVWANESWGRYWGWDSKETWALISIIVYTCVLHFRFIAFSPFIFAVMSVFAFFSILMTYFGVNYYLSGLHSYASGDPLSIPIFVYVLLGVLIVLVILASFKRRLELDLN